MLDRFFHIREKGSTPGREVVAGLTTFSAMAYIIVVNPGILEDAGLPKEATAMATCLAAAIGTLLMGFYARLPFAIAPYMGENAFIAFSVVGVLKFSWQQALAAILVGGILFVFLTLFRLRTYLADAIPHGLRISFVVGIGLFLVFIGLEKTGIIVNGPADAPPVGMGDLREAPVLLAIGCFALMGVFLVWRMSSGIFLSMALTYLVGIVLKVTPPPAQWMEPPDFSALGQIASLWPVTEWQLDFSAFLEARFLMAVFVPVFLMDFFDTIGTLIGVSERAGFLKEDGSLPDIEKPMMCDALATVAGALLGTTTTGTYIESAAGIESGGRTGLSAVVTGLLFLLALFFAPVFTSIPAYAYGPALIIVGLLMMQTVAKIKMDDVTEVLPAFAVIVLMPLTYNIGIGMAAGFLLHPLFKLLGGKTRDLSPGSLIFAAASLVLFIFFPY